jgi:hypothetical protein
LGFELLVGGTMSNSAGCFSLISTLVFLIDAFFEDLAFREGLAFDFLDLIEVYFLEAADYLLKSDFLGVLASFSSPSIISSSISSSSYSEDSCCSY